MTSTSKISSLIDPPPHLPMHTPPAPSTQITLHLPVTLRINLPVTYPLSSKAPPSARPNCQLISVCARGGQSRRSQLGSPVWMNTGIRPITSPCYLFCLFCLGLSLSPCDWSTHSLQLAHTHNPPDLSVVFFHGLLSPLFFSSLAEFFLF